jgi:hypothetical protein
LAKYEKLQRREINGRCSSATDYFTEKIGLLDIIILVGL